MQDEVGTKRSRIYPLILQIEVLLVPDLVNHVYVSKHRCIALVWLFLFIVYDAIAVVCLEVVHCTISVVYNFLILEVKLEYFLVIHSSYQVHRVAMSRLLHLQVWSFVALHGHCVARVAIWVA